MRIFNLMRLYTAGNFYAVSMYLCLFKLNYHNWLLKKGAMDLMITLKFASDQHLVSNQSLALFK